MIKVKSLALGTAATMLVSSLAIPAQATTSLYSGGGTLAEKIYRDIMNCYGSHGGGAGSGDTTAFLAGNATGCNGATPYNANTLLLYVGVGSGNGKAGFTHHNSALFTFNGSIKKPDSPPVPSTTLDGPYYNDPANTGSGVGPGWLPDTTGTAAGFPTISFVGSDDPLNGSDITTYNTNTNGWGAPVQFPGLITTITIPYNPAAGTWTEKGKKPSGGGNSGLFDLSQTTLCGIFNGDIQQWNDPAITKDNSNVVLGTGQITVTYRSDSSGSTFLTSNALVNQCASTTHPIPAAWQSAGTSSTPNVPGVGNNSFFINVKASLGVQNGTTNTTGLPANFVGASGSGGVKTAINTTSGSIGYVSPDFAQPVDGTGPKAANLQTWVSFKNATTAIFKAPGSKAGTAIVGTTKAPSFTAGSCPTGTAAGQSPDGKCADNALNWGVTFPTPLGTSAYPIGGFTFIDTYTCYANAASVTALASTTAGSLGYLRWYYGSTTENGGLVTAQLSANGFAPAPTSWLTAIKKLLTTNQPTKLSTPGTAKTGCASVSGTGA
jgi:ABC-type phosphate transport system substrate-binding protein